MFDYPVVFVDIETTGGSYRSSRVLEVAAIRYEHGEITAEFSSLINPETYIPSSITALTGICESDIVDAPVFADIADQLAEIMDGAVFVAHNVRFDYSFLKNEFALISRDFTPKLLCTVRLSRYLYKEEQGHSLAKLIARYDIPFTSRHRALDDARAILYFSRMAFEHRGSELFTIAIEHQLKSQSLPPNLDKEEIEAIENVPGVYIFQDETRQPLYVGKSINLKKRVMSHFQDIRSGKEVRISQNIHHVETIPTGNELAALLLESKLVKELKPIFNRRLRRVTSYAMLVKSEGDSYATIHIKQGNVELDTDLDTIYGMYASRMKAKNSLEETTRIFQLCPKLMGLEKTKGACFLYSLGKCKGACIGEESPELYDRRFEIAMEHSRLKSWPFDTPIAIPVNIKGEQVIIKNWMVQGYVDETGDIAYDAEDPNFDMDEYKIIQRFIRENRQFIRIVQD
jgi:DNA polymerase-3 subunit epsilon